MTLPKIWMLILLHQNGADRSKHWIKFKIKVQTLERNLNRVLLQWSRFIFLWSAQVLFIFFIYQTSQDQIRGRHAPVSLILWWKKLVQYIHLNNISLPGSRSHLKRSHRDMKALFLPCVQTPLMLARSVDPPMVVNELETIQVLGKWSSELLMLLEWL